MNWAASSEFGTYRLCEQRRFRRACASAQSRQNLRCSLIQAVCQEEPSDRTPDPWPLWMAGHAQLKFVMTECSKTQIRLTRPNCRGPVCLGHCGSQLIFNRQDKVSVALGVKKDNSLLKKKKKKKKNIFIVHPNTLKWPNRRALWQNRVLNSKCWFGWHLKPRFCRL